MNKKELELRAEAAAEADDRRSTPVDEPGAFMYPHDAVRAIRKQAYRNGYIDGALSATTERDSEILNFREALLAALYRLDRLTDGFVVDKAERDKAMETYHVVLAALEGK